MNFTFLNLVGYTLLAVVAFLLWRGSASLSARLVSLGLLGLILWGLLSGDGTAEDSRFRGYQEDAFELSSRADCVGCSTGKRDGVWFVRGTVLDGVMVLKAKRAVAYKIVWAGGGGVYVDGRLRSGNCFSQQLGPQGIADLRLDGALQARLEVGPGLGCG
ncbi:hypothetical protein [Calidithermus roseus]|uniref:Uncharacterized protein n=1 Tax=Calidithermus roseus TaxID=1644118 RepID=A0A399F0D1_9DEIN|nr:hypothetical protein [Calidithermus roseus]RIH88232.1 hypothetical protein Mrose_00961 [Calidithermus roseus]